MDPDETPVGPIAGPRPRNLRRTAAPTGDRNRVVGRINLQTLHELPSTSSDSDGTPTPRSRVARMTKRHLPTGRCKSASRAEARTLWRNAIFYNDIRPISRSCGSYGPGHGVHFVQAKKSWDEEQPLVDVFESGRSREGMTRVRRYRRQTPGAHGQKLPSSLTISKAKRTDSAKCKAPAFVSYSST